MNIASLNLDNCTSVNQGFDPPEITNVYWNLVNQSFDLISRVLTLDVQFTANNFTQQRTFTYTIDEEVEQMGKPEMMALLLNEDSLKNSTE